MPENLTQYSPSVENPQVETLRQLYTKLHTTFPLESRIQVHYNPPPQRASESVEGKVKSWILNEPDMKIVLNLRLLDQQGERQFEIEADRLGNTTFVNEVLSVKSHGKDTPVLELCKA
jgi:hypothetical protein